MAFGKALRWLAAGLAPLIAACEDGPSVVSNFNKEASLIQSVLTHASTGGPVLAEIHGNPWGLEEPAFARIVLDRFSEAIQGKVITYTTLEREAPHPNIRVIVVFNALEALPGHRLCEGRMPEVQFNPVKMTVRAVLCADGDLVSDAEGVARNLEGPNDRRFRRLVGDLARALLRA